MGTILDRIQEISKAEGMTIGAMERSIGASKGVLSRAISNGTDIQSKWIQIMVENYPHYSAEWLLTGRGDMKRGEMNKAAISYNQKEGVPYFDVDFIGGFDCILNNQTVVPTHNIVFDPFAKASFWCNVTGRSMEPKINHGDIIALKECRMDDIQYGEVYAVVLDNIRTIKIIRKSEDPNKLKFVPINIENFDEQEFDKSRIIKIYEVLGCISKFF